MKKILIQNDTRVLIIDDEEELCILLKAFISKKGAKVEYLLKLKDCLDKISTLKPNIVFLDNNLPDGIGLDFIERIKAIDKGIFLIMISAMTHLQEKALTNGADLFMEKPISFRAINELTAAS